MGAIFAYGSLMGDNTFRNYEGRRARLPGYHRSFNHTSTLRWGTADHPCPVLGLSPGGECWGVAFQIPPKDEKDVLRQLDRREAAGEYRRAQERVETADGPAECWVWLTRPDRANGKHFSDETTLLSGLRSAHGMVGDGVEYVRALVHAFDLYDIDDPLVRSLWGKLRP